MLIVRTSISRHFADFICEEHFAFRRSGVSFAVKTQFISPGEPPAADVFDAATHSRFFEIEALARIVPGRFHAVSAGHAGAFGLT